MARKSKKPGVKKLQINLTNRWLYTLIIIGILAVTGIGVYALTPGVAPNPGHLISNVAPPSPCAAGQFLKFDGTNWACADVTAGGGVETDPLWTADSTNVGFINKANVFGAFDQSFLGNVGIGITNPEGYKLAVGGPILSAGPLYTSQYGFFSKGIILGDSNETLLCSSDFVGMLRYRRPCAESVCISYLEICMQTDTATYTWYAIKSYTWGGGGGGDSGGGGPPEYGDICEPGQTYYWCLGWYALPGCYDYEPDGCYVWIS